jgi:hypothetical protein
VAFGPTAALTGLHDEQDLHVNRKNHENPVKTAAESMDQIADDTLPTKQTRRSNV